MVNKAALAIVKILFAKTKKDVEKICDETVMDAATLSEFIELCDSERLPWNYLYLSHDFYPKGASWTDKDYEKSKIVGSAEAAKASAKLEQLFNERRLLVGHLFYFPDYSNWHLFYFDNRDLKSEANHFYGGQHIHLINYLSMPNLHPEAVVDVFKAEKPKLKGAFHIRFRR